MPLTIATQPTPDGVRVSVAGEVDVSCADELREVVSAAVATDVATIEVDLAEVPYIDSTGIGVIVGAAHRAAEAGRTLRVTRVQRNVARVLGMLGLTAELGLDDAPTDAE